MILKTTHIFRSCLWIWKAIYPSHFHHAIKFIINKKSQQPRMGKGDSWNNINADLLCFEILKCFLREKKSYLDNKLFQLNKNSKKSQIVGWNLKGRESGDFSKLLDQFLQSLHAGVAQTGKWRLEAGWGGESGQGAGCCGMRRSRLLLGVTLNYRVLQVQVTKKLDQCPHPH